MCGNWRWVDVSFLVSLFFGVLCRAGFPNIRQTLLKQVSNYKGFPHSDKNIPVKTNNVRVSDWKNTDILYIETNWKTLPLVLFVLCSRNCFTWIYFILFIYLHKITVTQLQKRWSYILCLHMFFQRQRVYIFKPTRVCVGVGQCMLASASPS